MPPHTAVVPCPVALLSVAGDEKPNIITISWVVNVCSKPPSVVVGIRPQRHSHALVRKAGDFVLNIPSTNQIDEVEFCGSKSGREYDKFTECKFTPIPSSKIKSPMIKECGINLECITTKSLNLGVHDLFIAEIVAVHMDEAILDEKGKLDPSQMHLFTYLPPIGEYWALGKHLR